MSRHRDTHVVSPSPALILEHFEELPDPRREHGKLPDLSAIVFMAICAVLCGADTWQESADYAESKADWLKTVLTLGGACRRTTRSAASSACSIPTPSKRVSSVG